MFPLTCEARNSPSYSSLTVAGVSALAIFVGRLLPMDYNTNITIWGCEGYIHCHHQIETKSSSSAGLFFSHIHLHFLKFPPQRILHRNWLWTALCWQKFEWWRKSRKYGTVTHIKDENVLSWKLHKLMIGWLCSNESVLTLPIQSAGYTKSK